MGVYDEQNGGGEEWWRKRKCVYENLIMKRFSVISRVGYKILFWDTIYKDN